MQTPELSPESLAGLKAAAKQLNDITEGAGDTAFVMAVLAAAGAVMAQTEATQAVLAELKEWRAEQVYATAELVPGDLIPGDAQPTPSLTPPRIGAWWEGQGGLYAGIARGADGAPDHHLILSNVTPASDLSWQLAQEWAAGLQANGHTDWAAPTRAESALLFANLRSEIAPRWHWTSEQYSAVFAWSQLFDDGTQSSLDKDYEGRVRAVRRLVIQPFNPS